MSTAIQKSAPNLQLAFDVGHSSIGWAVLEAGIGKSLALLGCGSVIFPADDCLASERRGFRRQRRHIRATRLRIARLKRLLAHLGVVTTQGLESNECAWPWLLAARVLRGGKMLSWRELWEVLRWYAHNRGYDGNKGWSRHDAASAEDTEKEQRANELLAEFRKKHDRAGTMAEVFCDVLKVDPLGTVKSSTVRVRNLGAAFPREGVEAEVERVLRAHVRVLPLCDERFINAVMRDYTALPGPDYRLPARYGQRLADGSLSAGGLLFGQLVPRFDNRIIARCPITFERVYQRVKEEDADEERAKHEAEKLAKVPGIDCVEFHRFRWAMQLANVQVSTGDERKTRRLSVTERVAVNGEMEKHGYLTPGEFKKAVRALTNKAADNLDQLLSHPDADRALVLDPVRRFIHTHSIVSAVWPILPEPLRKRLIGKWRRSHAITVGELLALCPAIEPQISLHLDAQNSKKRKQDQPLTREALLRTPLQIPPLNGRAPHTREIMREVSAFVLNTDRHPMEGSDGALDNGPLFRGEEIRRAQLQRALDEQTNNHLVRHRLKLLERLHEDLVKEYAAGDRERIGRVTIEVNRDVKEMSGKSAQEQAKETGQQLAHFKNVAKKLDGDLEGKTYNGRPIHISAGLIRKGRIAEDLGWKCPYTGKDFSALALASGAVDKDHIIPRSERASDSLDSLVITFKAVNLFKGKRTAVRFVEEEQGKAVPGMPQLSIKTLTRYQKDVDALETFKGHDDDQRRKKNRKRLLALRDYVEKEFTPGDLTKTSQLVRLGAQALQKHYVGVEKQPVINSLPGSVTGAVRKSWNLLGCLAVANPLVLNAKDIGADGNPKLHTKTDIRGITHLHHALDACVLAFASLFLPRDGGALELLVKRRLNADDQKRARQHFGDMIAITQDGELRLADLAPHLKEQVCARLKERRVVQHLPKDLSGLRCKETVWRVFDPTDTHLNSQRLARWLAQKEIPVPAPDAKTALIICRKRRSADAAPEESAGGKVFRETKTWRWVYDIKDKSALLGFAPDGDVADAKLKRIKAVKVLGDNFGLALDPEPKLIRPHKIWHQLDALRKANAGKAPRVLRIGLLIRVKERAKKSDYRGTWMLRGVQLNQISGFLVDLSPADQIAYRKQPGCFQQVSVATLVKCGLEVLNAPLCGIAPKPIED